MATEGVGGQKSQNLVNVVYERPFKTVHQELSDLNFLTFQQKISFDCLSPGINILLQHQGTFHQGFFIRIEWS